MLDNRYLTIVEFGRWLRIGRNKAYKIVKNDCTLPLIRIDRKILIDKSKLDEWIKNKEQTSLNL